MSFSKDLYSNPKNLVYYLLKSDFSDLHAKIIKKQSFDTALGRVELAIIGASHYLKLENSFFEILSCLPEKTTENCMEQKKDFEVMNVVKDLEIVKYRFATYQKQFDEQKQFELAEKEIYNQKNTLIHAFSEKSAITALLLKHNENKMSLKTWHTYPEFLTVVYSETVVDLSY